MFVSELLSSLTHYVERGSLSACPCQPVCGILMSPQTFDSSVKKNFIMIAWEETQLISQDEASVTCCYWKTLCWHTRVWASRRCLCLTLQTTSLSHTHTKYGHWNSPTQKSSHPSKANIWHETANIPKALLKSLHWQNFLITWCIHCLSQQKKSKKVISM